MRSRFVERLDLVEHMHALGYLDVTSVLEVLAATDYYPDEYDDFEDTLPGVGPGTYNAFWNAPPAPAAPRPTPPKPGDKWPGKCPKCGNERVVVWQVDWPTIRLICKLCGKEQEVKK